MRGNIPKIKLNFSGFVLRFMTAFRIPKSKNLKIFLMIQNENCQNFGLYINSNPCALLLFCAPYGKKRMHMLSKKT